MKLNIPGKILLNSLAGSQAYGLNTSDSDEDYRGVFVADKRSFYTSDYPLEVSDELNNSSYFELSKFAELLIRNNPTVLEFLAFPKGCVRELNPAFELFMEENFLSKQCQNSYVGYALGQIRKAYNLKKRISFPESDEEKTPLDFCQVFHNGKLAPLRNSELEKNGLSLSTFLDKENIYSIWNADEESRIEFDQREPIVKEVGEQFKGYMLYDKLGFNKYKKEYRSYFLWKRDRKLNGLSDLQGNYDGKFLMHTFRLLYTAKDIAQKGELILVRPEREKLLNIRAHKFEFGELIKEAEDLVDEVRELFKGSDLPNQVDEDRVLDIVAEIREQVY